MDERRTSKWGPADSSAGARAFRTAESDDSSLGLLLANAIRIIRHRKLLAVAVFGLFVIPPGVYIKQRPPKYQATARILLESNDEVQSVLKETRTGDQASNDFQTELQVLRSRPIVAKTIADNKLWTAAGFASRTPITAGTEAEVSAAGLVDVFLSQLTIWPTPGTHILNIRFESTNPTTAMTAVNALVKTHIDEATKAQFAASGEALDWLSDRLAEARDRLRASETALQEYIETNNAVSLQDRQNIVVQKLADLNSAVTRAKTDRIAKQTLYDQLRMMQDGRAAVDALPVVLSSGVLQQLRTQLADLKQRESSLSQDLGDRHPDIVKLRAEIDGIDERLRAELAKILEAVKNEYLAAEAQELNLTRALDAQKRDVFDLNRKEVEFAALQRQASSDREIYQRLLGEVQTRAVTGKTPERRIQIVESAELPRGPLGPPEIQQLALVMAGGFLLALSAPLIRESLDRRIKTPADLEDRLKLRCLVMVPSVPPDSSGKGPLLTSEANAFNEAFRRLRATLFLESSGSGATRLLVTSATPREGKSTIATNLAMAIAQMKVKVLLIDGDLRRPKIHKILGLSPFPGFADLLNGEAAAADVIRQTNVPNLYVLPCGTKHVSASELLSSDRLELALRHFDQSFDWIVFDSPPTGPVADACVLGQWAHHALLVASAAATPTSAVRAALDQLVTARVSVIGAVLNRVDLQRSGYYYAPYYTGEYADYYSKGAVNLGRAAAGRAQ